MLAAAGIEVIADEPDQFMKRDRRRRGHDADETCQDQQKRILPQPEPRHPSVDKKPQSGPTCTDTGNHPPEDTTDSPSMPMDESV